MGEISDAAKSGDGSLEKVGIKVNGKFKSPVTNQWFDTQEALDLHLKFLHDPKKSLQYGGVKLIQVNISCFKQYCRRLVCTELCMRLNSSTCDRRGVFDYIWIRRHFFACEGQLVFISSVGLVFGRVGLNERICIDDTEM